MESSHKTRGFIRGKLSKAKSFLRATSKPCLPMQFISNKVSPSPHTPNGSVALASHGLSHIPKPNHWVSSVYPSSYTSHYGTTSIDFSSTQTISRVSRSNFHDFPGDENIDVKAASYILNVRERFKQEKFDS